MSEAWIFVESDLYEPEKLYYQLLVFPNEHLSRQISKIVEEHWNDRVAVFNCSEVTEIGWVTPRWRRNLTAGVFDSESGARALAERLGLEPKFIPFDKERDEKSRAEQIRAVLSEYAEYPNARERIARERPELDRFLREHPAFLEMLERAPTESP